MSRKWVASSENMAVALSSVSDSGRDALLFAIWGNSSDPGVAGFRDDVALMRRMWSKAREVGLLIGITLIIVDDKNKSLRGEFLREFGRLALQSELSGFTVRVQQLQPSHSSETVETSLESEISPKRGSLRLLRTLAQAEKLIFRLVLLLIMGLTSLSFIIYKCHALWPGLH